MTHMTTMTYMTRAALAIGIAGSASAQDMIVNIYATPLPNTYVVGSEYFGGLPAGATSIGTHWADASFELESSSTDVSIIAYNPGYDTPLGDAVITNSGGTASFVGNTNTFFGTPDPSNPLFVAAFTFDGPLVDLSLALVGQNSAEFLGPGSPFGIFQFYQYASGNPPGELSFGTGFFGFQSVSLDQVPWIPTPATGTIVALGALTLSSRRRRK